MPPKTKMEREQRHNLVSLWFDEKMLKKLERLAKMTVLSHLPKFERVMKAQVVVLFQEYVSEVLPNIRGKDGITPTDRKLLKIIKPLVPAAPSDKELLILIKPLIPKVNDGHTPTDEELTELIQFLMPDFSEGNVIRKVLDRWLNTVILAKRSNFLSIFSSNHKLTKL